MTERISPIDRILLWIVRRRLSRHHKRADSADLLGDALVKLLAAEIERRNRELVGWDSEWKAAQVRAVAEKVFEKLDSSTVEFRQ